MASAASVSTNASAASVSTACRKLIVGEQLAVLSPKLCQNGSDKPQDSGYVKIYGSLS